MSILIRKALITEFGDASKVHVIDSVIEKPEQNEVQVSVIYAGFSGTDVNMRMGAYPFQKKAPLTPGYCLVGKVEVNGPGCSKFQTGDIVTAITVYDAQADRINMPEKYLNEVPQNLDPKQAVALTVDWSTAYGMVLAAHVSRGQKVFVHGMSGAVGYGVMKLCQLQGAEVFGTASERNHEAIKAEGGHPFVYTDKRWINATTDMGGMHAVFDPLGFESWDESYSILRKLGSSILVGYGGNLLSLTEAEPRSVLWPTIKLFLRNWMFWSGKRTHFYYITRDQSSFRPNLQTLFELSGQGNIVVPIKKAWKLDEIQNAHRAWTAGSGGIGSILIEVNQS